MAIPYLSAVERPQPALWSEKVSTLTGGTYAKPINLLRKMQRHRAFGGLIWVP